MQYLQSTILALLNLFRSHVPDRQSNKQVAALISDEMKWPTAHEMFGKIRGKLLEADKAGDSLRQCQYGFEEICLKTVYNETASESSRPAPFDSDSPFFVVPNAFHLARSVGIPDSDILSIIAPK
jgi:hypothetical protein